MRDVFCRNNTKIELFSGNSGCGILWNIYDFANGQVKLLFLFHTARQLIHIYHIFVFTVYGIYFLFLFKDCEQGYHSV